jgi:Ala-tRNA(Pro) deacylase
MAIAASVQDFLNHERVPFELVRHSHTADSAHTAQSAHVSGNQLAKSVVLKDGDGFLIAVIPASHRVDLGALHRHLNRPLGLATERELAELFADCEPGAVPPIGALYGIDTVLDESLAAAEDVYFEGGDHMALVHVSGDDFLRLMADSPRGRFSHHA